MSTDEAFERLLADRLSASAFTGTDDELDAILTTTSRTRPVPLWLAFLKEPPMRSHSSVAVGSPMVRVTSIMFLTILLVAALAAAAIGAGASLLPGPNPAPAFGPAANGPLAYSRDGDIHLVDPDGTHDRVIVEGPDIDVGAGFSHDGQHMFFVRDPDTAPKLMVARPDGTGARVLMDPGVDWIEDLPDGRSIVAAVGDPVVLKIIDIDTGTVVKDLDLGGPEPTGWVAARPGDSHELILTAYPVPREPDIALYGYDLDTAAVRMIGAPTTGESPRDADATDASHIQWSFQNPSLSPDGSTIAYWNWETPPGGWSSGPFAHARDVETGAEVTLQFLPTAVVSYRVTYASDGTSVAFRAGEPSHLYMSRVDGSQNAKPVGGFFSYLDSQGFDFSPDSTRILHTTTSPAGTTIYDVGSGTEVWLDGVTERPGWQRLAR